MAVLTLVLVAAGVGCTSWDRTLDQVVRPVHGLVHHQWPERLVDGAQAVEMLAWEEASAAVRSDAAALLAPFARVDRTECIIVDAAAEADVLGVTQFERAAARVTMDEDLLWVLTTVRVQGVDALDEPLTLEQERVVRCARRDGEWRLAGAVVRGKRTLREPSLRFVDEAAERGLVFSNASRQVPDRLGRPQVYHPGSGLGVADVDGDGDDDVLMVGGGELALFINDAGVLRNATEESGLRTPPVGECRAAFFGDVDADGDPDCLLVMLGADNVLFRNEGGARFRPLSEGETGLWSTGHATTASFADFDADGDLDLFLGNGNNMMAVDPEPPWAARNGTPDQYFDNLGDGTFVDATDRAGFGDTGWALATAVSDYDRDGDLDLFLANDLGRDRLYRNRGDGRFDEVSTKAGLVHHGNSMSADWGDVDRDGWPDLAVSGMSSGSRWMTRQPGYPNPAPFPLNVLFADIVYDTIWQLFHGNRLYLNNRDGTFREVSEGSGTRQMGWGWAWLFADLDNDADEDLYGLNGFWSGNKPDDL